jgi:hypothetical protein
MSLRLGRFPYHVVDYPLHYVGYPIETNISKYSRRMERITLVQGELGRIKKLLFPPNSAVPCSLVLITILATLHPARETKP